MNCAPITSFELVKCTVARSGRELHRTVLGEYMSLRDGEEAAVAYLMTQQPVAESCDFSASNIEELTRIFGKVALGVLWTLERPTRRATLIEPYNCGAWCLRLRPVRTYASELLSAEQQPIANSNDDEQ